MLSATQRRRLLFAALYFSEGAPIGWLWWALPSQLRRAGVEVSAITALTAALAVPWMLKMLWAPLVDVLQTRWFGLRAWVVTAQLGMTATLIPMLGLDPTRHWQAMFGLLLAHAFCAATQDVAIDALAIRSVPARERGTLNGAMQAGYLSGRVLFSAGVLALAANGHDAMAVPMLLAVLSVTLLLVCWARPADGDHARAPRTPGRRTRLAKALLRSPRIWRLALFALLGGCGFEAAGALFGPWLVDRGFDDGDIAWLRLLTAAAMIAGALIGGRMADRSGTDTAVRRWLVATAAAVAGTATLDAASHPIVTSCGYAAVYLTIGGFTASSYALFMQNSRGALAATVFSAFMGLTNACESWAGALAGDLQHGSGYATALLVAAALSLPALLLVPSRR